LTNNLVPGILTYIDYCDDLNTGELIRQNIDEVTCGYNYPVFPPVLMANAKRVQNLTLTPSKPKTGYKVSAIIQWTGDAEIEQMMVNTTSHENTMSPGQQEKLVTRTL
jgi:hypothetical protein